MRDIIRNNTDCSLRGDETVNIFKSTNINQQTASGIEKVVPAARITAKGMSVLSQELKRQSMY
ncbi:hypothetical protein MCO_01841 [Bartonella sp. DB5-6]|nr:hypothetical protein MCO_01841 [Bartonella sp. DB5-6]